MAPPPKEAPTRAHAAKAYILLLYDTTHTPLSPLPPHPPTHNHTPPTREDTDPKPKPNPKKRKKP